MKLGETLSFFGSVKKLSEGEFKRRLMPLADRKATLNDLHTTQEVLNILEDAKKEFVTCCEPNHYIRLFDGRLPLEDCPNYKWFKKYFGEAK